MDSAEAGVTLHCVNRLCDFTLVNVRFDFLLSTKRRLYANKTMVLSCAAWAGAVVVCAVLAAAGEFCIQIEPFLW